MAALARRPPAARRGASTGDRDGGLGVAHGGACHYECLPGFMRPFETSSDPVFAFALRCDGTQRTDEKRWIGREIGCSVTHVAFVTGDGATSRKDCAVAVQRLSAHTDGDTAADSATHKQKLDAFERPAPVWGMWSG